MKIQIEVIKRQLVASCPNCRSRTLYSLRKRQDWVGSSTEEVLACNSCMLVIPVEDLKKLLHCT